MRDAYTDQLDSIRDDLVGMARLVREASRPRRAARTVPTADDEGPGPAGSSSAPHRTTTTTPRGAQ